MAYLFFSFIFSNVFDNKIHKIEICYDDEYALDKNIIENSLKEAEKQLEKTDLEDQNRFLINQKIDALKIISVN